MQATADKQTDEHSNAKELWNAFEQFQNAMKDESEAGLYTDDDIMKMVKEMRDANSDRY